MTQTIGLIVDSNAFHHIVLVVIVTAAGVVGLETYPQLMAEYGRLSGLG
jgi:hypothetical protein